MRNQDIIKNHFEAGLSSNPAKDIPKNLLIIAIVGWAWYQWLVRWERLVGAQAVQRARLWGVCLPVCRVFVEVRRPIYFSNAFESYHSLPYPNPIPALYLSLSYLYP